MAKHDGCGLLCELLVLLLACVPFTEAQVSRTYNMDEYSTCDGRSLIVDDNGVRLNARGPTAPANPPTTCIVYLMSTYRENDGTNKLQIRVEEINAIHCEVIINIYNGHRAAGSVLKSLGCDQGSIGLFYSTGNEITIRLTLPERSNKDYQFRLLVTPYKDENALPTVKKVDKLSVAAIIGICMGCIVVLAIIILFCWCCCTGRLAGNSFSSGSILNNIPFRSRGNDEKTDLGTKSVVGQRGKPGVLDLNDPQVWNTVTTGRYEPGKNSQRAQNRQPNLMLGRRFERERAPLSNREANRQSGHYYEPYDMDSKQGREDYHDYTNQRRSPRESRRQESKKETMIDDVFDSDSNKGSEKTADTDVEDTNLHKKLPDSQVPEEEKLAKGSPQLERYLSMDLASQPDLDTISSPLHINAGVRASVEDEAGSPSGSLRRKNKSPKSKRKGNGKDEGGPDPMAMPPEAFEPIFTKPISGIDYQGSNRNLYNQPQGFPGGFIPYGMVPTGAFAPGTQTYAYAYQTVPQQGLPGQQGAWFVQNTPTGEGNRRTAFAVQETIGSPDKRMTTPERRRRKNSDPFRKGGRQGGKDLDDPDLSIIARGAAPPNPGRGQRTIEMKSGTDPDSKVHSTQVTWTDTVPDASDPPPEVDNPQITRKTITRVATKSGHGDLPQHATLLALEDNNPAFLSPSSRTRTPPPAILPPAASTPANENLAFYTGREPQPSMAPPERTTALPSPHNAPTYNSAIRDRIPFDSTV